MKTIGDRIKSIRKSKKISQGELASGICTQSNISRIEKGIHVPTLYLIDQIARKLDVDVEDLLSSEYKKFEKIQILSKKFIDEQNYKDLFYLIDGVIFEESYYQKKYMYWLNAITSYYYKNNVGMAKIYITTAKSIFTEIVDYELDLNILNAESIINRDTYDKEKLNNLYVEMLKILNKRNINNDLSIKILQTISTHYFYEKDFEKVLEISSKALKLLKETKSNYILEYHLYNNSIAKYYINNCKSKEIILNLELAKHLAIYKNNEKFVEIIEESLQEIQSKETTI